jgi:hypothetical protein
VYVSVQGCAAGFLEQLPLAQSRTSWALAPAGRAHFELLVDSRSAAKAFEEARRVYVQFMLLFLSNIASANT